MKTKKQSEKTPIDTEAKPTQPIENVRPIQQLTDAVVFHGADCTVKNAEGHSGPGFYVWNSQYPDQGASFLGSDPSALCGVIEQLVERLADAEAELTAKEG